MINKVIPLVVMLVAFGGGALFHLGVTTGNPHALLLSGLAVVSSAIFCPQVGDE